MRLRVAAIVVLGDAVVLVRHVKGDEAYHLLPGGGVEPGETLAETLVREVREETGLIVEPGAPVFIGDSIAPDGTRHMVQITFLATVIGGALTHSPEDPRVLAVDLVDLSDLGALDLRPPMAVEIQAAATVGYVEPARYLGPLWSDARTVVKEADARGGDTVPDNGFRFT